MTKDSSKTVPAKDKAREIPEETLDKVAGGLNPQPLPPRSGGRGGY